MQGFPGGGRGHKKNYKGRGRHFTDAEELKQQKDKEERERQWRRTQGDESDEEGAAAKKDDSGSESDSDEEEKHKGVEHLIEVENPNRVAPKTKKVDALQSGDKASVQLSRREREELEKEQAKQRYQQLHMQGKTDEAREDLARLALIRKQREEAAKKREEERKAKEAKSAGKKS